MSQLLPSIFDNLFLEGVSLILAIILMIIMFIANISGTQSDVKTDDVVLKIVVFRSFQ